MHPDAFPLLARIHPATDPHTRTDDTLPDDVRRAVAVLTAAAAPDRAARLAPGPGEAPVLVARLAAWALRRVGPDAIAAAVAELDTHPAAEVEEPGSGEAAALTVALARTPREDVASGLLGGSSSR